MTITGAARVEAMKLGLAALLVGLAGYIAWKKFADGTLNPTSENNVANQAANAVWSAVTGEPDATIGGSVYDWTHTDNADDLSMLVSLFRNQGVNEATLATARRLGWTETDISRARSMVNFAVP